MSNFEKEQRVQHHEKEVSRSRIPRLILRPHLPQQQHKVSPASESPFSEEESREFNASSSGRSARTISSNSFCSGIVPMEATQSRSVCSAGALWMDWGVPLRAWFYTSVSRMNCLRLHLFGPFDLQYSSFNTNGNLHLFLYVILVYNLPHEI